MTAYLQKAQAFYDQNTKIRRFAKGEWVLRRIPEVVQKGKFNEQWEGPFEVKEIIGKRDFLIDECIKQKGRAVYLKCYVFEKVLLVMNEGGIVGRLIENPNPV